MPKSKIHVLHIDSEYGWRGGQQQAAYLLEGMHQMGYKVAMVCQPGSELAHYCQDNALDFLPLRMHGEFDLLAGYAIARHCRKEGFTILQAHAAHAHAIALWAKLCYPRLKLVCTRRVDFSIRNSLFSRLKYTNPLVDRIVCISDLIRQVLFGDGVPAKLLTTIHSGVDVNKFDGLTVPEKFRQDLGIPADAFLVGTVAAIVGHKDYPTLLRAARIVLDRREGVTFCAVGDGDLKASMLKLAHELGLGQRFIFTGYRRDVGVFLKNFDLFVLSSQLEGLGTSILDAQAVGLPVVACHSGGIPEIVKNGVSGVLVPARNPQTLAQAILDLAANEKLRRRLSARAKVAVKDFAIDQTVQHYLALYNDLVAVS
jgi:glycosyltransferase involved in cell wall biosynthesis